MHWTLLGPFMATLGALSTATAVLLVRKTTVTGRSFDAVLATIWINAIIFIPISIFTLGTNFLFTRLSILSFILSSLIGTVLGRICYYASVEKIGASLTSPISRGNLLVATVFSILVLGEKLTIGHFLGIIFLLFGVIMVSHEIEKDDQKSSINLNLKLLLPLAVVVFFGLSTPLFSLGLSEETPLFAGFSLKAIAALAAFISYSQLRGFSPLRPFRGKQKQYYLYIGIIQTIGFFFIFSALSVSRVVVVTPFQNLEPLFVLIFSYLFLDKLERITKEIVLGSLLVVVGTILIGIFM